jgi:Effector-associated domain 10
MSTYDDLSNVIGRIANGENSQEDMKALRELLRTSGDGNAIQLGKYNVDIRQGQDIQIGDRIYHGTDAEAIKEALRVVLREMTIKNEIINKDINIKYLGNMKINICRRLTQDWQDLADYFDIKPHERIGFKPGREAHGVWEWLEQRNRLGELENALNEIGRKDLVEELKKK